MYKASSRTASPVTHRNPLSKKLKENKFLRRSSLHTGFRHSYLPASDPGMLGLKACVRIANKLSQILEIRTYPCINNTSRFFKMSFLKFIASIYEENYNHSYLRLNSIHFNISFTYF